jgi:glycine/D-amino acid oxidase-like deaminating enzyme
MNAAKFMPITGTPRQSSYDVVIIGGAVMGASTAWFLSANPDFDGSVLVVERDTTFEFSSTSRTNACLRHQFSNAINIQISQFGAEFVRNFQRYMGDDPEVPELTFDDFGYMYLAGDNAFAAELRTNQALQESLGSGTKILTPAEILEAYPFYNIDGIVCGSHNLIDEGYFDSGTMFDWMRRKARHSGVEYLSNEVVGIGKDGTRVHSVELASGETIDAGVVVNAAGPRAAGIAEMAGFALPVEPRRRYTFVFDAAEPLDRRLPLTIDSTGVTCRTDGGLYMAGGPPEPEDDPAVAYDDFDFVGDIWEDKIWPSIANRIPAFERVKVLNKWVGHYAYNTLDTNAVVGRHPTVENFIFVNGFSGHGMQQSPGMGRGVSELITYDEYRSLDLRQLGYQRILDNEPFLETAII